MLDKNTFGGSRAAEVLVDMLNKSEDVKLQHRVARLFAQYSAGMWMISDNIPDPHMRRSLLRMWREHEMVRAVEARLPEKVHTYLLNIEKALAATVDKWHLEHKTK